MKIILFLISTFLVVNLIYGGEKDDLSIKIEILIDSLDPPLPVIEPFLEEYISDVSICKGPGHTYFLTGTTGDRGGVQKGIRVWSSRDLKNWNLIGNNGYVWSFDNDGKFWQKEILNINGIKKRGIISPKIHYMKDNFWISYSLSNSNKSGVLKSTTGNPEGPYADISGNEPLVSGSNASLFMDTDSTVYFTWDNGKIVKMKDDMSGFLNSQVILLTDVTGNSIGNSGVYLTLIDGTYMLVGSKWTGNNSNCTNNNSSYENPEQLIDSRLDCIIATSKNIFGPYSSPYISIPHGGGNMIFEDFERKLWGTFFCNKESSAPFYERPSLIPLNYKDNKLTYSHNYGFFPSDTTNIVYVSREGNNSNGNSWDNAYTSLQRAIDYSPNNSQIWMAKGNYDSSVRIDLREAIYIYGGFSGNEKSLEERNIEKNPVVLNGKRSEKHVVSITTSKYIRIDGLTIKGGNASGGSTNQQYGAGIHMLGGGETIRLANCIIEDNKADQDGGGLYASIGASPLIINCTFKNNTAKNNGGAAAINCNSSNGYYARFYNCIIDNNTAYGDGGAIYFDSNLRNTGLLKIVNSVISNNYTQQEFGTIALDRSANLFMLNSVVCLNEGSYNSTVISKLGRIPSYNRIINCIFYANRGGTLFNIEGEASFEKKGSSSENTKIWTAFNNCVFWENETNSIVSRNFDNKEWNSVNDLNSSLIGEKNDSYNPGFIDPFAGDFHIKQDSRCKNKGTQNYCFEIDYDGDSRINLQNNSSSAIDIGIDELR